MLVRANREAHLLPHPGSARRVLFRLTLLACGVVFGLRPAPARAQSSFYGIGFLPTQTRESMGIGLSHSGLVVGSAGYQKLANGDHHQGQPVHAVVPNSLVLYPTLAISRQGGVALGVSPNGKTTIGYVYADDPGGDLGFHATRWDVQNPNSPVVLKTLGSFDNARADGYSQDRDFVVGYSQMGASGLPGVVRACVWLDPTLVFGLSEELPGAVPNSSKALSISRNGTVIVGCLKVDSGSGPVLQPCVWTHDSIGAGTWRSRVNPKTTIPAGTPKTKLLFPNTLATLPLLPGTVGGSALDVSEDGALIVGHCFDADGTYVPCRWDRQIILGAYTPKAISGASNGSTGTAQAVSGTGEVIVGYLSIHDPSTDTFSSVGWISRNGGPLKPLLEELASAGLSGSIQDWLLLVPNDVARIDGGIGITGYGTHVVLPDSLEEGWRAVLGGH